jgi:hypothetical protein
MAPSTGTKSICCGECLNLLKKKKCRPGSSVGIVTDYWLDGPGIASRGGRDFSKTFRLALGAHPANHTKGTGSFQGVKRPGRGADHPPTSSAEVENE